MPTRFVGFHLAAIAIVVLVGLSFLVDPCGGGGDLCLGGYLGVFALGAAVFGVVCVGVWLVSRRASPLLMWDTCVIALAGLLTISLSSSGIGALALGALAVLALTIPGAILAAREVGGHRIERALAIAFFVVIAVLGVEGLVVGVIGLIAMGTGWFARRGLATPGPAAS